MMPFTGMFLMKSTKCGSLQNILRTFIYLFRDERDMNTSVVFCHAINLALLMFVRTYVPVPSAVCV